MLQSYVIVKLPDEEVELIKEGEPIATIVAMANTPEEALERWEKLTADNPSHHYMAMRITQFSRMPRTSYRKGRTVSTEE